MTRPRLDNPLRKTQSADSGGENPTLREAIARALIAGLGFSYTHLAIAQPSSTDENLEEVRVTERPPDRSFVERSELSKLTEDIADTPQAITTLPRELLDDRNVTSLNEALRTVPGITLGAGEFSWQGTNPNIRGFSARDDMYLDGLRDFGSYPRDPFNYETIEVLLGPSSVLFGRGSTGGAINQVSKRPTLETATNININAGSNDTLRGTLDLNRPVKLLGDTAAFRVNVVAHDGEVADRDGASIKRFGFSPTLALGIGSGTELTLSYLKQISDDRPDYGLPWLDGRPAPVRRANFYGFDSDFLETDADVLTGRISHQLGGSTDFNAVARYATYDRESRITEPLITDPGASVPSVFRYVFLGDSEETLLTTQAGVTKGFTTGSVEHSLVAGIEISRETSEPVFGFGTGAPAADLFNPVSSVPFTGSTDPRVVADTTGETFALYVLDTLTFSERWLVTLGLRSDRFDADYTATRFPGPPTPFNDGTDSGFEAFARTDRVTSYRAALVYKPSAETSLYLAGSTSFNPSAQSLSFLTTGRALGTGNTFLDPEENESIEAGFKAELNAGRLLFTTSLFEIKKNNARVPDPTNPGFNTLGGEQRVRGTSFELNGGVTEQIYVSLGYTYLDSEVIRAAPGAVAGAQLANAPEHSLSAWVDVALSDRLDMGFGARYVSEQLAQNTGAGKSVSSFTVIDAMARYHFSDTVTFKLNLTNLTDELYFDLLHPWHVVPGPGPTATVALNLTF